MDGKEKKEEKKEAKKEEKKDFICYMCKLRVNYNYFGKKPPFSKGFVLTEDSYVMKDPFSSESGMIMLGSHCDVCQKSVCAATDCSMFYSKRFCLPCAQKYQEEFPTEIQLELRKKALQAR